ncbi:MAG: hypothetical protein WC866_02155 [Patescibacteria group bacterium]|jgi:hypothetical protein
MDFREAFRGHHKVFLAVVHVENEAQTLRNVAHARDNGAHGVFLINHNIDVLGLLAVYRRARIAHLDWWLGVNALDLAPMETLRHVPSDVSGLWFDRGGIDLSSDDPTREARAIVRAHDRNSSWRGVHFGGVAFKYQPQAGDPALEACMAVPYMDVLTTSGEATGQPPSIAKIEAMRGAIGDKPLAIASGMTPENVDVYLDYVDCVLVATGVSFSHTELDPVRVRALSDIVRAR